MVTALTHDIRIRVQTLYQPDFSDPAETRYFFSYFIHITNLGSEKVKLISRHWNIVDSMGSEREIEGPGVVGEQPEISPGSSHKYSSSCNLNTAFGEMWGYYTFLRVGDGSEFQAEIPRFRMEVPFLLN
jgi:ApaG protein